MNMHWLTDLSGKRIGHVELGRDITEETKLLQQAAAAAREGRMETVNSIAAAVTARGREQLTGVLRSPSGLLQILGVSFAAILFSQVAYLEAIDWTNSATATIMQSLGMVLVLVYVCLKMRRRPRRRELLGVVLALVGTYLVATGGNPGQLNLPPEGLASCIR